MILKAYESYLYASLRIVAGFLFLWHGSQKLLGIPPMNGEAPAFVVYIAGPIELVGGLLVMLGFLTHWAAFLCSGLMAAAYWTAHASISGGLGGLLPLLNRGELAALYCFVFLFISARGAGIWSVDAALGGAGTSGAGSPARS